MSLLLVTSGDIASGDIASGVVAPEGVDFDGTYDYLSRSTDLVGNVDSKTFTFSCFGYKTRTTNEMIFYIGASFRFQVYFSSTGFVISGKNSSNTAIFSATVTDVIPQNTFISIIVSIDLYNTSNRAIYINDKLANVTWNTYTNGYIDFTNSIHNIISYDNGTGWFFKGRLSHVFLDYTYRDLSIEANRRLFITADGKPTPTATLKALNPILYLPMKDSATAHINEGTGGNFTLNGTIATSERGANQDNCVASYFDGSADYLSRTSLTGIADGKQVTFSCTVKLGTSAFGDIFELYSSTQYRFYVACTNQRITVLGANSSNTVICNISTAISSYPFARQYTLSISVDLSDSSKTVLSVNGVIVTVSQTIVNDFINFSSATSYLIMKGSVYYTIGNIGELYFDTKYIDLATNNPFWIED